MKIFIVILLMLLPRGALGSDYEDCVMDKMKDAHSNYAIQLLTQTCYKLTMPKVCRGENLDKYKHLASEEKSFRNKDEIIAIQAQMQNLLTKEKNYVKPIGIENLDAFMSSPSYKLVSVKMKLKDYTEATESEILDYCRKYCEESNYFSKKFGECSNDW